MTDEQQVRSLLRLAAELADDVQAPVSSLLVRARRKRQIRAVSSVAAAAVLAAAAVTLPSIIHGLSGGSSAPNASRGGGNSGPTVADLTRFRWSSLRPSPLGRRSQPLLAWTGRKLIELSGLNNDGAAFDPATGRWRRIAPVRGNVGFSNAVDAWTGRELFVTDGQFLSCATPGGPPDCWPHAGLYNPAANTWSTVMLPRQMFGLDLQSAVWTGRDVVIAGTNVSKLEVPAKSPFGVAAYNPLTHRWRVITPRLPAGHPPRYIAMAATPGRLLLWSLWDVVTTRKNSVSDRAGVDVVSLGSDGTWRVVTGAWPQDQNVTAPTFTGYAILVSPGQTWCGRLCIPPYRYYPGYFADPATLARTTIPLGPLGQANPVFAWTGRAILAVNMNSEISGPGTHIRPDDMALYDPVTNRWRSLPPPPGRPGIAANPVWTGRQLLALTAAGTLLAFHS